MRTYFKQWKPSLSSVIIIALICTGATATLSAELDVVVQYKTSPTSIEFYTDNEDYQVVSVSCKSVQAVIESQNNICDNLEPCTKYIATVTLSSSDGDIQSGSDQTMDVATSYATPEVTLVEVVPDQFSMLIKWNAVNRSCISIIEITLKASNKVVNNNVQNSQTSLNVENLNPCQTYDILINTTDVKNEVVGEPIQSSGTTHSAAPENVTNIQFVQSEEKDMKITWDSPVYSTCIEYLYLKWATVTCIAEMNSNTKRRLLTNDTEESTEPFADEGCKWNTKVITDSNTKEYIIQNLDGCEVYGTVFYINDYVEPKSELSFFTSPEQVPGEMVYGTHAISSTAVTVAWDPPKQNSKCVLKYLISVVGPLQNSPELQDTYSQSTENNFANFENLDPCGKYTITVQAISLNGTGGIAIESSIATEEDSPSNIRNPLVHARPKELVLQWDPPEFAELCLEGYRITGWYDTSSTSVFDLDTNETEITIDNLISCQVYTVQVIPYTKTKDGLPEQIEETTSPIVAAQPDPFQTTAIYSHSLELSARVKNEDFLSNKCPILFAKFDCDTSDNVPYKKVIQYVEGRVGDLSFKASMSPLSPFTNYVCQVYLYNTAGWSEGSFGHFITDKYYPEQPLNVDVKSRTTTAIRFQWNAPKYANGNINVYLLYFRGVQAAYYIPPFCNSEPTKVSNAETSRLETEFASLQPYMYYSVQIAAQNEYGTGEYTLPLLERTLPFTSEVVTNLKVVSISGPDITSPTFKAEMVMSWRMPCRSNGEIDYLEIEFSGQRTGYSPVAFVRTVQPNYDDQGVMTYKETELSPEYTYTAFVSVVNKDVIFKSDSTSLTFQAPAGIPDKIEDVSTAKVDAFDASNPTTSAVVQFPINILSSTSGTILYVALLLSQKDCNPDPELQVGALDSSMEWPDSSSWMDSYSNSECIQQYQTTPIRWQPVETTKLSRDNSGVIEYTIGTEVCTNTTKRYCNGPLNADTEYQLVIRLFTKSSYSDAAVLEFKTDSLIKLTLILIAVVSCLLVAFIAGFLYMYITKKIIWHRESCHGIEDSSGDITSKNFATFYPEVSKWDKLQREFKELTVIATDFSYSASEANEYKNRYRDIFPYDKNRVILDIDADGNDYINASFINGYRRKKEYIATQGPKQESIVDFWRMVLQHNVRIIVMVTQFKEEDVVKCHHYYPWEWKDFKVEIHKQDYFDLYDRREIIVTHAKQNIRRKIVHFYFKKWPDHGVPTDPMSLITFVKKVKAEKCPRDSPIVVHCSAGVGRTGTFIGLDIIMQRLKSESKVNIFETVKELRFQRMKMVQSMQQYTFLYICTYQLVIQKHGKGKNNKKVSFKNEDDDTTMGTMQKVGVADAESGECNI